MCKTATKAAGNIYYQARIEASEQDDRLRSRTGASELLNINEATLAKYELETLTVHNEMALLMSEIYKTPELLTHYCCQKCAIGKKLYEDVEVGSLESVALRTANDLMKANEMKNSLISIAADGRIDETEVVKMNEILEYLSKIRTLATEIELWAKKYMELEAS